MISQEQRQRYREADRERKRNRTPEEKEKDNKKLREKYAADPEFKKNRMKTYSKYNKKRLSVDDTLAPKSVALERLAAARADTPPDAPREFSSLEVRAILGLKHNEYYKLVNNGYLKAYKDGKNYKIKEADLLKYINSVD